MWDLIVSVPDHCLSFYLIQPPRCTKWRLVLLRRKCDKQPKWLPKREQDKRSEARSSRKFQVPGSIISEIFSRIAQTTAALSRLKIILKLSWCGR